MEEDECPDSTVMDDDDIEDQMAAVSYSHHRRSFDEPQSSRVSSSGAGSSPYCAPNFSMLPQQLPPLPKLIFRPPTHAGNYPSVSFSSHHSGLPSSRASSSSSSSAVASSSRSDSPVGSRLTPYPSSRSESFPGTRMNVNAPSSSREIPLPRLESMTRSELTISRVNSTPIRGEGLANLKVSSTSRNEFGRVGGVSISRISDGPSLFSRASSSSGNQAPRIEIPQLTRIGSSMGQQAQADSSPSRRFVGRRFLKSPATSSSKPGLQPAPPRMTIMRASSSDEYYTTGPLSSLHTDDQMSVDNDSAVDFAHASSSSSSGMRRSPYPAPSTVTSSTRRTTLVASETLTSHQGSQGIKLHISKKPVEVVEDDSSSERSNASMASSVQNNSDSNNGNSSTPSSGSASATNSSSDMSTDDMSVKPVKIKVPLVERLKLPAGIRMDCADEEDDDDDDEDDDDDNKAPQEESNDSSSSDNGAADNDVQESPFLKHIVIKNVAGKVLQIDNSSRRTRRKRQPVATPVTIVPPKVRKRRGAAATSMGRGEPPEPPPTPVMVIGDAAEAGNTPSPRGRGRGTGRGRGRPRGSTNKAKIERELSLRKQLQQAQHEEDEVQKRRESKSPDMTEAVKDSDSESPEKVTKESPGVADTTSPEVVEGIQPLSFGGDPEVNAEIGSAVTPAKRTRGGRGSRGGTPRTPRGSRGSRGTRGQRTPRGEKKSPEAKKLKMEKKEAIKAPPPVQVFEEETRMSADIKPPIPDRVTALSTPVILDEESRASNLSSTSTSTSKAKRFTKDPIQETKPVTAETLFEYQWPLNDKNADFFFLQEQISEFLGVKSFKRKYPDIRRRLVDMEERDYLRNTKVVSETQCDLGLTAVHSCDVLDIMFADFSDKYEEYRKAYQERKEAEMSKLKPDSGVETPAIRDRSAEFMRRILKSCAKWNMTNNKERMQERQCAFDLQTGTLHYPKDKFKTLPPSATEKGHFPVAVLNGQYTDNYKEYTPDELFYMPLNTVRYGPVSEDWIVESEHTSEESSESEESSSTDDSSGTSSEDEDGSVMDGDVNQIVLSDDAGKVLYRGVPGKTKVSVEANCKTCEGTCNRNKDSRSEVLLHCSRCDIANHPTCLELTLDMLPFITKYHWECTDCKNCIQCNDPADEDKMLFCDCCDRGYHIYCVGLRKVPTGRWHCSVCSLCYSCGVTQPSPEDRMAEWHHEYRKGEKGAKFYLHSFCVSCYKLFKKGHFCPSCHKVHVKVDKSELLECRKCEKWVHKACVKRPLKSMFGFMCDPCDANFRSRSKLPSHVN